MNDILIIVKHSEKGDAENGKTMCDAIRKKTAGTNGPLCLYHDATDMANANAGYAGEFKKLDKDLADRVVEVVCAIPGSIPRMMAHTVAMFSSKKWSIFKDRAEAIKYLNAAGYSLTEMDIVKADAVSLKVMHHDVA
jgi:hypothetical protein